VTEIMVNELLDAYRLFDRDERVRAIVLTGAGKAFRAGADLEVVLAVYSASKKMRNRSFNLGIRKAACSNI
jgi:enoyl-CoA hydratase/carnithine racemase